MSEGHKNIMKKIKIFLKRKNKFKQQADNE